MSAARVPSPVLIFENSFLEIYLAFLRDQLAQEEEVVRRLAERRLKLIEIIR